MSIPKHTTPTQFTVPNKFPDPPKFTRDPDENNAMFQQYHTDLIQVLTRQFTTLTQKIDTKQDKS